MPAVILTEPVSKTWADNCPDNTGNYNNQPEKAPAVTV